MRTSLGVAQHPVGFIHRSGRSSGAAVPILELQHWTHDSQHQPRTAIRFLLIRQHRPSSKLASKALSLFHIAHRDVTCSRATFRRALRADNPACIQRA